MRPISVRIPVGEHHRAGLARQAAGAREDEVGGLQRAVRAGPAPAAPAWRSTGADSPVRVDMSSSSAPDTRRASALTRSPSLHRDQVAGHQGGGVHLPLAPVAYHRDRRGDEAPQRLDRPLGVALLQEGDERVQHDHHDDRDGERRRAGHQREGGGGPQQQGQRVHELADDLGERARAARGAPGRSGRGPGGGGRPPARSGRSGRPGLGRRGRLRSRGHAGRPRPARRRRRRRPRRAARPCALRRSRSAAGRATSSGRRA